MPDKLDNLTIVRTHLSAVLHIDPETIRSDAHIITLPNADSLRLTEAITRIEDQLSISLLDRDDLLYVRTVADLVHLAGTVAEHPAASELT